MTNSMPVNTMEAHRSNGMGGEVADVNMSSRGIESFKRDLPAIETMDSNGRSTMILDYHSG